MTNHPPCAHCNRPTPDGVTCHHCGVTHATALLASIQLHHPAAAARAARLTHTTTGHTTGKPASRPPINIHTTARLRAAESILRGWITHVWHERFGHSPVSHHPAALRPHLEWLRHRPNAADFLNDMERVDALLRTLADPAPERRYLGPCGAHGEIDVSTGIGPMAGVRQTIPGLRCDGDVYATVGARHGHCTTCHTRHNTTERQAWLDATIRAYAFTPTEIHAAYGIRRNTINQWAARGRLTPHSTDHTGQHRYVLGHVLDLAAKEADRRRTP